MIFAILPESGNQDGIVLAGRIGNGCAIWEATDMPGPFNWIVYRDDLGTVFTKAAQEFPQYALPILIK